MKVTKLHISNILSIETAEVAFDSAGLVLVDGWNADDDAANGAGKSAIFNALAFGLYGKMPRDITATEYLRKGTKAGWVEVIIEIAGDTWSIRRERPTNLVIQKNGEIDPISQPELECLLGLTYSQFLISMYASQLKTDKFLYLNDAGKKDFLLQLINLEKFNLARELAVKNVKDLQQKATQLESSLSALSVRIQTTQSYLADEEPLLARLESCSADSLKAQVVDLQQVQKPDLSKYSQLESGIKKKRKYFNELRQQLTALKAERATTLKQRRVMADFDTIACPHCSGAVVASSSGLLKADDVHSRRQALDAENARIEGSVAGLTEQISSLTVEIDAEKEVDVLEAKLKDKQSADMEAYYLATSQIAELKGQIDRINLERKQIEQKLNDIRAKQAQIAQYQGEFDGLMERKIALLADLTMAETLSAVFSPVGVQAYVADMLLDRLNERVAFHLSQIWPNASYMLTSFKETKSGEVRAKFSEKIIVGGREASLGSLSGGEKCCISLALDLAIVDVVSQVTGAVLNPVILDEPFDGMDSANRERAIEALTQLSIDRQIIVIDHASEVKALFSRVIRVVKKNGITSVSA